MVLIPDIGVGNQTLGTGVAGIDTANVGTGAAGSGNEQLRQVMVVGDPVTQNTTQVSSTGRERVQQDATQLFYEAWDSGLIDTTIKWLTPLLGGTASISVVPGTASFVSGLVANNYVYLRSLPSFQPVSPGFLEFDHQIGLTSALPAHTYSFWGCGTPLSVPLSTGYATDAIGWEIGATGKLYAVTWQSGVRGLQTDLSSSGTNVQPIDANVHRYQTYVRGDTVYWVLDNVTVASIVTGALGPNSNLLPVLMLVGTDATGSASSLTLSSAAFYLADSSKSVLMLGDGINAFRMATVRNGPPVSTDMGLVTYGQNIISDKYGNLLNILNGELPSADGDARISLDSIASELRQIKFILSAWTGVTPIDMQGE